MPSMHVTNTSRENRHLIGRERPLGLREIVKRLRIGQATLRCKHQDEDQCRDGETHNGAKYRNCEVCPRASHRFLPNVKDEPRRDLARFLALQES